MPRLGVTPLMDENDYRLVYLVCLVHFVRFVCLPLLLDSSLWRLHANPPYAAPVWSIWSFWSISSISFLNPRRGSMPLLGEGVDFSRPPSR
jgi:hypothetical protein